MINYFLEIFRTWYFSPQVSVLVQLIKNKKNYAWRTKRRTIWKQLLQSHETFMLLIIGKLNPMHIIIVNVWLEVGIGGEYDCTNIIRNPVVTGIQLQAFKCL